MEKETIICSAILINDGIEHDDQPTNVEIGYIISGRRHNNCYATLKAIVGSDMMGAILKYKHDGREGQGFITSLNRYVNRKEALEIAKKENQLLAPTLLSGDNEFGLASEDLFPTDWETFKY